MSETIPSTSASPEVARFPDLEPDSFLASQLKHASPEHLHLTSRRFFIGPIPEGWLNSNRKAWYKRRLELTNYSSRAATFTADQQIHNVHHRTSSNARQPSIAARMQFSFPQPQDVFEEGSAVHERSEESSNTSDETDEDMETTSLAPVSTADDRLVNGNAVDKTGPEAPKTGDSGMERPAGVRDRVDSWQTAREQQALTSSSADEDIGRPSTSTQTAGLSVTADNFDNNSRTGLLQTESLVNQGGIRPSTPQNLAQNSPDPVTSPGKSPFIRQKSTGVRFKVAEGVAGRQHRIGKHVDSARIKVANRMVRRDALKEGTIVKMDRMLVRMDMTNQQLADGFDENESIKTETTQIEKWTEFMVVARKSSKQDEADFRLQFYKTRVIPEIEHEKTKKKPAREIKLLAKSTHVNLFSSLDKTVVMWHPYRKGTRIAILRPNSAAQSIEWYTFLRDALGWNRPDTLQVNVPDLDVALHLERPFQALEQASIEAEDETTAVRRTMEAENAVATQIITQSMDLLRTDPEWSQVLKQWTENENMGLAWKRYDRLEWVYGTNERKMYGSMAMQNSYDLELRPKHHYPTSTPTGKGSVAQEPAPVEGFLVRLTSQKGLHKRFGKAFFKRLYFATQDHYLVFNRPAKAIPPHPPRLGTISGTNIPSSADIVRRSPLMFDVEPYKVENGRIKWLRDGHTGAVRQHEYEAIHEGQRNISNIIASDGIINMCEILMVRKLTWGAGEADAALDSGSDVDFHVEVDNTTQEDGVTREIDDDRTFELVLENGLIVRLQAYSKETRDEWIRRLRRLVTYWKMRTAADINLHKSVRQSNLTQLNIDEEMEARLGQFAHKWEVSRSDASPDLYNLCRLVYCRNITISGPLYRKVRKHSTFYRCNVVLTGGQMLVYQSSIRKATGEKIPHIHQEKQQIIDLRDCYVYSGLIVEEDLLYANRTFDANHAGMLAATPRIYLDDGWTSADVDVMTCFVVWMNRRKGWFRSALDDGGDASSNVGSKPKDAAKGGTRSRLRRVTQLGVPGRGMVFKCRSRAERDLWVLGVAAEIENAIEIEARQQGEAGLSMNDVRLER